MDNLPGRDAKGFQNTETVVPPPDGEPKPMPLFTQYHFPHYGDAVLLIIPTSNEHKTQILLAAFESQKPANVSMHHIVIPAESEVGEQPYDGAGVLGAYNRISNALQALATSPENQAVFTKERIGTVIAASIENYIQAAGVPRAVDYGVVMVHNATTGQTVTGISRGVTVPQAFVARARLDGFEDEDRSHGKVTVGSILAAGVSGLDKADWHAVLAGTSRYDLLKETIDALAIPW
ncbi:uncharacterized protein C8A04DRAFT_33027 [Dichotomopilus funicola]|uniref:Non-canonical purine NTP phosphatase/PRRC1 domain-containing protein n=1 Tax=Dichotomopilus funicola TaxID=1934379 RepID=A0AAN6UX52_9PEZI|nr:hypothetical protein C8A04DRAFT_33027 [Dichotomopilus funicola]